MSDVVKIFSDKEIEKVAQSICTFFKRSRKKRQSRIVSEKKVSVKKGKSQARKWSKWKKRK